MRYGLCYVLMHVLPFVSVSMGTTRLSFCYVFSEKCCKDIFVSSVKSPWRVIDGMIREENLIVYES